MVKPKQLGHLVLRVRNVEKSEQFYANVLGLETTTKVPGRMVFMSANDNASHELALMAIAPDAPGPESDRVGLYHFAWEMESFEDLQKLYKELKDKKVNIGGIGNHGISLGVYFFDPDGNEIEVFHELPREEWPEGNWFSGKYPRSLEEPVAAS